MIKVIAIVVIAILIISLYACLIVGKREDEDLQSLFLKREQDIRKGGE